ncbi:MAG: hypothetical protein KKE20_06455 [Nanoarchaeota archaeon]|nr:hypothetical protein [Nanoarchaeota archaeon]
MKKQEAIRILKTEKQYICSAPGTYHLAYAPMIGFTRMDRHFKEFYKYEIVLYKDRHIYQCESWDQAFRNMKQLYDDPKNTKKIIEEWRKQKKGFYEYCKSLSDPAKLSDKDIFGEYWKFMDQFSDVWAAPLVTDGSGVYTESELWEDFLKEVKSEEARKIFLEMTQSQELSFLAQNKLGLLKLTLKCRSKDKDLKEKLKEHQQSFFYVENTYEKVRYITEDNLLERIKKDKRSDKEIKEEVRKLENPELKAKQEKLFKEIKMS